MTEPPPPALLRLLTWLSPAFPTGAFAYSHGLEWAVEAGDVRDGASLRDWLDVVLAHGSGWSDAVLLRHAHRAAAWESPERLAAIAALARAATPSRERREEALAQGGAFGLAASAWEAGLCPADRAPRDGAPPRQTPYAVAVGALAGAHGIAEDAAAIGFLHAFAANLVSAAVRLVPLGQSAGVAVLAATEPRLLAVAADTRDAPLEAIGGCAFRVDLASMRHETQYTRLFRS